MASPTSPELEDEIKDVGNKLLSDTSSIVELLSLLDKAENLLSTLPQEPPTPVADAMLPIMKALIRRELLNHAEMDIKASVASCLHEVLRITAPDTPYEDKVMEETFKLTVKLLKKLSLDSGHCYTKAVSVLLSMANVRSCLVMLDIEVDELIVEMFQLFFRIISPHHPISVMSAMEKIMTLIIDEIEGMPFELMSPLLFSMRKGNQDVSPLSCKLGENVFKNCAAKLRPYLPQGLRLSACDMNAYSDIVSSTLQNGPERDLKVVQAKEPVPETTGCGADNPLVDGSSHFIINNETSQKEDTQTFEKNTGEILEGSAGKIEDLSNSNYAGGKFGYSVSPSQKLEGSYRKRGRPKRNKDSIVPGGDTPKKSSGKKKVSFSASRSCGEDESQLTKLSEGSGKRRRSKEKQQFGEELIGRRVKVWWPMDEVFYDGAIYSYDPVRKKHRVLYTDGEEELLDLSTEIFNFVDNDFPDENVNEEQKDDDMANTMKSDSANLTSSKDQSGSFKGETSKGKKKKKESENFKNFKDQSGSVKGEYGSSGRDKRKKKSENSNLEIGA